MKILLLGIGKSGTTALMTSMANALGLPYQMEPRHLGRLDYSQAFIAKKLVDSYVPGEEAAIARFDTVIFLVRDPRDALISRLMYTPYGLPVFAQDEVLRRYTGLISRKIADPAAVSVRDIITELRALSGYRMIQTTLGIQARLTGLLDRFADTAILLRYEDYIDGRTDAIDALIGRKLPTSVEVDRQYRRVIRNKGYGDWKNWFTEADKRYFDKIFAEHNARFGYRPEAVNAVQTIDPAKSVGYVIAVVNESRAKRRKPLFIPDPV